MPTLSVRVAVHDRHTITYFATLDAATLLQLDDLHSAVLCPGPWGLKGVKIVDMGGGPWRRVDAMIIFPVSSRRRAQQDSDMPHDKCVIAMRYVITALRELCRVNGWTYAMV